MAPKFIESKPDKACSVLTALNFRVSKERTEKYPRGIPIHDLQPA